VRLAQCWSAGDKRDSARGAEAEALTLEA
jgi:hypothetical protein